MKIALPLSASKTQYYINMAYVEYIKEAGMEPVIVTPLNDANTVMNICDGLMLPGGGDLDPIFYGENNIASYKVDPEKDDFERKLFCTARTLKKPIFGICRGFQLIIREFMTNHPDHSKWFSFYQHVEDHQLASALDLPRSVPAHSVEFSQNLYGKDGGRLTMFVNSMHHQALLVDFPKMKKGHRGAEGPLQVMKRDGNLIEVLAITRYGLKKNDTDRIVEAFALNWGSRVLAVQWHPEELKDYHLIQAFFGVESEKKKNKGEA